MYPKRDYFEAKVYTTWVHGPLGFVFLPAWNKQYISMFSLVLSLQSEKKRRLPSDCQPEE